MSLEQYKNKLKELKKVRSDATQGFWIHSHKKVSKNHVGVCGILSSITICEIGGYQYDYYCKDNKLNDSAFIATAANEWDKLISDLEICVECLEEIKNSLRNNEDELASRCLQNLKLR